MKPADAQGGSPLFKTLPPEVRTHIFSLALADYPDPSPDRQYRITTYFTRPSYFAPRRSDTELLRTCRAIYRECWFLPFLLKEQTWWLTSPDRAPPEFSAHYALRELQAELLQVAKQLGDDDFVIERLRVFAQMWRIEEGGMGAVLRTKSLHPRVVTLTIRHADWWWWENDDPLRFEGDWLKGIYQDLSPATQEFRIELESLERKKGQVDAIAAQMRQRWFFRKSDDTIMLADKSGKDDEISRWSGTSTWNHQRWIRDETTEDQLDFYIRTVKFRPEKVLARRGGEPSEEASRAAKNGTFDMARLRLLAEGRQLPSEQAFIRVGGPIYHIYEDDDDEDDDDEDDDEDEYEEDEDDDDGDEDSE